ncbi:DUF2878 domain-containing protein [Pseudoalteromonas sp. A25]|uniref:DUF2878 domain-containing protein n=1 Tax=Pseudoalteromonas sp. A25 TaxID=116092 RepID=UPI0012610944
MFQHTVPIRLITNFALFQACWLLALFYQANALWLMCIVCVLLLITNHSFKKQCLLLVLALPAGLSVELVAIYTGMIQHPENALPSWLVVLWIAFILTFDSSLKGILSLPRYLGAIVVAAFAPASYIAAANFGVFEIMVSTSQFYAVFGTAWLACTLFFIIIYDWLFTKC